MRDSRFPTLRASVWAIAGLMAISLARVVAGPLEDAEARLKVRRDQLAMVQKLGPENLDKVVDLLALPERKELLAQYVEFKAILRRLKEVKDTGGKEREIKTLERARDDRFTNVVELYDTLVSSHKTTIYVEEQQLKNFKARAK